MARSAFPGSQGRSEKRRPAELWLEMEEAFVRLHFVAQTLTEPQLRQSRTTFDNVYKLFHGSFFFF